MTPINAVRTANVSLGESRPAVSERKKPHKLDHEKYRARLHWMHPHLGRLTLTEVARERMDEIVARKHTGNRARSTAIWQWYGQF
jgi:hypothetical protein